MVGVGIVEAFGYLGAVFKGDYYLGTEFFMVEVWVVVALGPLGQFFSMDIMPEGDSFGAMGGFGGVGADMVPGAIEPGYGLRSTWRCGREFRGRRWGPSFAGHLHRCRLGPELDARQSAPWYKSE